ncbi:MAG: hypothetical protein ACREUW_04450 [Burkholderiales bacterium]
MTHATVINCTKLFKIRCPMQWDAFIQTGREDVHFCWRCQKMVYLCETPEAIAEAHSQNRCVAVPVADEGPGIERHFVGIPSME